MVDIHSRLTERTNQIKFGKMHVCCHTDAADTITMKGKGRPLFLKGILTSSSFVPTRLSNILVQSYQTNEKSPNYHLGYIIYLWHNKCPHNYCLIMYFSLDQWLLNMLIFYQWPNGIMSNFLKKDYTTLKDKDSINVITFIFCLRDVSVHNYIIISSWYII